VVVHFPGLGFRPGGSVFNPCQQFLRSQYNSLLSSFYDARIRPKAKKTTLLVLISDHMNFSATLKFLIPKVMQRNVLKCDSICAITFFQSSKADLMLLYADKQLPINLKII